MWSAHTGTPGIQYFYPLALDAVARDELSLRRVVDLMAANPAKHFGLGEVKGALLPGYDADVVVADLDAPWTITNDGVLSKTGWTCYDGRQLTAQVERTFVRGTEVYADGKVIGQPGHGRLATAREKETMA
jgi:dihydroorotase